MFLDSHVRGFEHFGSVSRRIRYDNLKAAVERVLKGRDRVESDRFVAVAGRIAWSHGEPDAIFFAQKCWGSPQILA